MPHTQMPTIQEAAHAFRTGIQSPLELLNVIIDRIHRFEPKLNTFISVWENEARAQALRAEKELRNGRDRGPLHGIPISLKDMIAYAEKETTNGSRRLPAFVPQQHATVTQKLLDAGAVLIGKSHLHEFAYSPPHPHYGWTRNPWDPSRIPGGSSSGSAAGLRAGFALGAIGTDSAGSIRVPASFCGVVGFKPTYGRISRYGVTPLSPTLDHVGLLAASCEDISSLVEAVAGYDRYDGATSTHLADRTTLSLRKLESLEGITLGVPDAYLKSGTEPDIRAAIIEALRQMEQAGAQLVPIELGVSLEEIKEITWSLLHAEAHRTHRDVLQDWSAGYSAKLQANLENGREYSDPQTYKTIFQLYEKTRQRIFQALDQTDALITPTCPVVAGHLTGPPSKNRASNGEFTPLANLCGLPAISVLAGFSGDGLPIGMQITGRLHEDGTVLSIGHFYEQLTSWRKQQPDESQWVDGK
ncbi:amidase [Paenibacillus sp. SI8]|uniref:amidase n=1 Tax=unclassified Paenibacillus TaxID=185978 RepID=UPI0034659F1C